MLQQDLIYMVELEYVLLDSCWKLVDKLYISYCRYAISEQSVMIEKAVLHFRGAIDKLDFDGPTLYLLE